MKAELKRADVTYEELAHRLEEMGIPETKRSLAVKINHRSFTAGFFLASLKVVGATAIRLEGL